jgi:hypothetical protein
MQSREEKLNKKHEKVRFSFDIPCMSPGASGPQTRVAYWIEDETDDYWASFDDGRSVPYRIPRKCITDMVPV